MAKSFPETSTGDDANDHRNQRQDLLGETDQRQVLLLVAPRSSLAAGRCFEGDAVSYVVGGDPTGNGNGDICVRTDKGRLVALVYAGAGLKPNVEIAEIIASVLNSALCPSHTDMMIAPGHLDRFMEDNPLPDPSQAS